MARDFEDHCWKDVVDAETMQIYQAYRRKIYVGDNPAVLPLDLYNKHYLALARPAVDAYSNGLHHTLGEECTYDRSMLGHKVNLFDLHHKYAGVRHVEEVGAHRDGLAQQRKVA